jgi:hypothetical protein
MLFAEFVGTERQETTSGFRVAKVVNVSSEEVFAREANTRAEETRIAP